MFNVQPRLAWLNQDRIAIYSAKRSHQEPFRNYNAHERNYLSTNHIKLINETSALCKKEMDKYDCPCCLVSYIYLPLMVVKTTGDNGPLEDVFYCIHFTITKSLISWEDDNPLFSLLLSLMSWNFFNINYTRICCLDDFRWNPLLGWEGLFVTLKI